MQDILLEDPLHCRAPEELEESLFSVLMIGVVSG